jgi:hypothetical protein
MGLLLFSLPPYLSTRKRRKLYMREVQTTTLLPIFTLVIRLLCAKDYTVGSSLRGDLLLLRYS